MAYTIQTYTIENNGTWSYNAPIPVEHKHAPMFCHKIGVMQTTSGYGKKIATDIMIKYRGKWRRVYCCIFSNSGTCYIGKLSDKTIVSGYPQ